MTVISGSGDAWVRHGAANTKSRSERKGDRVRFDNFCPDYTGLNPHASESNSPSSALATRRARALISNEAGRPHRREIALQSTGGQPRETRSPHSPIIVSARRVCSILSVDCISIPRGFFPCLPRPVPDCFAAMFTVCPALVRLLTAKRAIKGTCRLRPAAPNSAWFQNGGPRQKPDW